MQTLYYTTNNFMTRRDNVVDLAQYRQKLQAAQAPPAEEQWVEEFPPCEETTPLETAYTPRPRKSRARRKQRTLWCSELCASAAIVVMAVAFTVQILG